jgi:very-short-patch-repair endonuclease
MIVVGDSKQMKNPNTQFLSDSIVRFNLTKHGLDKHPKAEFFHGRKSLLDLADGCSDASSVFLNEHFRCEPPLIAFSNKNFYDGALKILTPFRIKRFTPCMEIKIINGAYDDPDGTKQNEIEADAVIAELKRMINHGELEGDKKGKRLSVGLLSPFRNQAALLQSKMYEAFEEDPSKIKEYEMIASTVDGFQGDERDVILYSFRYAPNSKPGSILALQRESDEHSLGRINVAFSRPRRKAVCFISVPKDKFPQGLFRNFLNHAAMEHSRPQSRLGNPNEREKCQSDFERDIFDEFAKEGLEIYAQVPCAGFFIDFVVIEHEGRRMAIECDGDFHYEEDGELREEDYQRQDIIERYGWFVYRIPARRYYANPKATIENLLSTLRQQMVDEEIGGFSDSYEYSMESEEIKTQEPVEEAETSSQYYEQTEQEESIEDKIIDLLSKEGPMPTWMIAGKIKLPRDETHNLLKTLEVKEWIMSIKEKGVTKWKEIL